MTNIVFYERLLEKLAKLKMNLYRLTVLCAEIYNTINNVNFKFLRKSFVVKKSKILVRKL